MSSMIPCECGCFDYQHTPISINDDKFFSDCLICDDCLRFRRIDNLTYLELLNAEKGL
jgi:hypothetical protein